VRPKFSKEYYKVGYYLGEEQRWAVYFSMESAQEAMMKMIKRGTNVTGMESATLCDS
jgi:hypothetical protein